MSLSIRPGEIVGLVGQSGSGKSVLSLAALGLLPAASRPEFAGKIMIGDTDMLQADADRRRRVRRDLTGAVFQDPMTSLNPTMRVGDQVIESTGSPAEARRLLEAVGITNAAQRMRAFPHELSGGLRQRIMIAIALGGNPSLIVADEPTTALDVTVQAQVLTLLRSMRDEFHCSVLMITHDLGVAGQVADRIAVMQQGELVEIGEAKQVLDRPAHPYTVSLIKSRPSLDREYPSSPPPETPETALRARHIECSFPVHIPRVGRRKLAALRGVNIEIDRGESLAVVGESGSGKSTLLRVIAGLNKSFSGSIDHLAPGDVQLVFQDAGASLTPWLTVRKVLLERIHRLKISREEKLERVRTALARVGLGPEVLDARPAELSGGQKQRVVLARAILIPPKILLCDEPTSALDVTLADTVLSILEELRTELGMTIIFVTHDLAVARRIGDRVAVMYLGRLVELGPVDEVIANPLHPYTRALLASVPEIGRAITADGIMASGGEPPNPLDPPPGCAYHPRCPLALDVCSDADLVLPLERVEPLSAGPRARQVACVRRAELSA